MADAVIHPGTEQRLWELASWLDGSAYRPPDWRYRIAQVCKDLPDDEIKKLKLDSHTRKLIRLYRYLQEELLKTGPERKPLLVLAQELIRRFGPLGRITALMYGESGRDVILDLQCFILARADEDLILRRFQLTAEELKVYKCCYFDVDDKLNNPHYIIHYVIFPHDKYNFVDSRALLLFLCYFNGLEAFEFVRYRSGLTKYVYTSDGVEPSDPTVVLRTLRWKCHFLLESVRTVDEFITVVKTIKDIFTEDRRDIHHLENRQVMEELYAVLRFNLKAKEDVRYLQGDPVEMALSQEIFKRSSE